MEEKKEWKMPKIEHGKLTKWNWLVYKSKGGKANG